jgi:hypothetical protein
MNMSKERGLHIRRLGIYDFSGGQQLACGRLSRGRPLSPRRLNFKRPFVNGLRYGGCRQKCKLRTPICLFVWRFFTFFLYFFRMSGKLHCLNACLPGFGLCQRSVRTSKSTSNLPAGSCQVQSQRVLPPLTTCSKKGPFNLFGIVSI